MAFWTEQSVLIIDGCISGMFARRGSTVVTVLSVHINATVSYQRTLPCSWLLKQNFKRSCYSWVIYLSVQTTTASLGGRHYTVSERSFVMNVRSGLRISKRGFYYSNARKACAKMLGYIHFLRSHAHFVYVVWSCSLVLIEQGKPEYEPVSQHFVFEELVSSPFCYF